MVGTTKTGFVFDVRNNLKDDYEFFEILSGTSNSPTDMPRLIEAVFGSEQTARLKDHVRKAYGYVSAAAMSAEFESCMDVLKEQEDIKNSSPSPTSTAQTAQPCCVI